MQNSGSDLAREERGSRRREGSRNKRRTWLLSRQRHHFQTSPRKCNLSAHCQASSHLLCDPFFTSCSMHCSLRLQIRMALVTDFLDLLSTTWSKYSVYTNSYSGNYGPMLKHTKKSKEAKVRNQMSSFCSTCSPLGDTDSPDPSPASPYLVLTAKASLTKLPDPSQASPTSHQQPRHLNKAAKPIVSKYIPWSKFPQENTLPLRVFLSPFSLILVAMG
jgi:hypothetical protein